MALLAVVGCGDDGVGAQSGDEGGTSGTDADSTTAATATSGVDTSGEETTGGSDPGTTLDPTPILDRTPAISHGCSELRPMTQPAGATSSRWDGVVADDDAFVALRSSISTAELVRVGLDGDIADGLTIDAHSSWPLSLLVDDTIALAWLHTDGRNPATLRFALADATPSLLTPAKAVWSGSGRPVSLAAAEDGGFALLFVEYDASGATQLRFMRLGAQGDPSGSPVDIADLGQVYGAAASAAAAPDNGLAVAYVQSSSDDDAEAWFVTIEGDGQPRGEPRLVSRPSAEGWRTDFGERPRRNLLRVGEHYWLASTEARLLAGAVESAVVRITILDENGDGTSHLLQGAVEGRTNLSASFVQLEDRVGVVWSSGTEPNFCVGCITDYDLQFVLIEPGAVVPASEVVTQLHPGNGITSPHAGVTGSDVLTLGSLDFHATTLPATGALRCAPAG